jgi:hypothetical protein
MVRNKSQISSNGKSPSKRPRTTSEENLIENENNSVDSSVHRKNLILFSFPLIILFNFFRSLLYQLFVIIRYIYKTTTKVIFNRFHPGIKRECGLEIVINSSGESGSGGVVDTINQPLEYHLAHSTEGGGQISEMSSGRSPGPGAGDPALAKQKHHHRRAFEYISKALKIDEENEGNGINSLVLTEIESHPFARWFPKQI